jgi:hypothetical protein
MGTPPPIHNYENCASDAEGFESRGIRFRLSGVTGTMLALPTDSQAKPPGWLASPVPRLGRGGDLQGPLCEKIPQKANLAKKKKRPFGS